MIWVLLLVLAVISTWFVIRPLLLSDGEQNASSSSLEVYRSQLVEVDADLARGIISTAEADAARVEIKRRILNLEEMPDRVAGPHVSRTMAVTTAAFLGVVLRDRARRRRGELPSFAASPTRGGAFVQLRLRF